MRILLFLLCFFSSCTKSDIAENTEKISINFNCEIILINNQIHIKIINNTYKKLSLKVPNIVLYTKDFDTRDGLLERNTIKCESFSNSECLLILNEKGCVTFKYNMQGSLHGKYYIEIDNEDINLLNNYIIFS